MTTEIPGSVASDLIVFYRGLYEHYAVNVGNGEIIHLTTNERLTSLDFVSEITWKISSTSSNRALVKKERFRDFLGAEVNFRVEKDEAPFPPDEIVKRARSKLNKRGYNLLFWNCEHFARWCRYNRRESKQVALFIGLLIFIVAMLIYFLLNRKQS